MNIEQIKQEAEKRYPFEVEELLYGHTRHTGRYDEYEAFVSGAKFAQKEDFKSIELIKSERERQVLQEGYSFEHDDTEKYGELSLAASIYACPKDFRDNIKFCWPWDIEYLHEDYTHTIDGRIRELVKAGALICAEIDRLERLKEKEL